MILHHRTQGIEIEGGYSRSIYSANEELMRMSLSKDDKYRARASLETIPKEIQEAFINKEDQYFYYHPGVNPISLIGAVYQTYFNKAGKFGASTITMQLARLHKKIKTNRVLGKLQQIAYAFTYEVLYSKDQILEAYLNLVPFGRNIEGVKAASVIYFKKPMAKLTELDRALMAVIPQRPGALNNHRSYKDIPDSLIETRNKLYQKVLGKSIDEELLKLPVRLHSIDELEFKAPHFTTLALKKFRGDEVRSSIDLELQELLQRKISGFVQANSYFKIKNAAAMLMDASTMKVVATVGSADFYKKEIYGQVDGTQAKRSPGSTLKPFLYALGFEQGIIIPKSIVYDLPADFNSPLNFDLDYLGPISVEDALFKSRNIPATDLLRRVKKPNFYSFLKGLGLQGIKEKDHYGSSIILGSLELTMEELVKLYGILANRGLLKELSYLAESKGHAGIPVLSPESTIMIKSILEKTGRPPEISNRRFKKSERKVYWKTGTSFGYRDAWSVGIMGQYVLAVWVGNFDSSPNPMFVGIKSAAPLFFEILDGLSLLRPRSWGVDSEYASNLTEVKVCQVSGQIPSKHCPKITTSLFIPGVSPIHNCEVHRPVKISKLSGKRICSKIKEDHQEIVLEHWPSQINQLFKRKGFSRKLPPAYDKRCNLEDKTNLGHNPIILSPKNGTSYPARIDEPIAKVPLKARADADVKHLYWYINKKYLGRFTSNQTVLSKLSPGVHQVKLVDDKGRSSSKSVKVFLVP